MPRHSVKPRVSYPAPSHPALRIARRHLCGELWARTNQAALWARDLDFRARVADVRLTMDEAAYFGRHCASLSHAALVAIHRAFAGDASQGKTELDQATAEVLVTFGEAHDLDYPLVKPTEPAP